jgi:hypothetical protein
MIWYTHSSIEVMKTELDASHVSSAWINVATFDRPEDADELCRLLRKESVDAQVQDERRLQKNWFLTKRSRAGIHVRVPEPSFAFARDYLERSGTAHHLAQCAVHCPSCGSPRVHFPQMTRKNLLPTLVAQLLVLVGVIRQEYYCEACQYTWKPGESRRPAMAGQRPVRSNPA